MCIGILFPCVSVCHMHVVPARSEGGVKCLGIGTTGGLLGAVTWVLEIEQVP